MCLARAGQDGKDGQGLNIRGTFDPGETYAKLDVVTKDYGWFVAISDDPGPCPGPGWKSGPVGKTGASGPRGPKGDKGDNGDTIIDWHLDQSRYLAVPILSSGKQGPPLQLRALFEQFQIETALNGHARTRPRYQWRPLTLDLTVLATVKQELGITDNNSDEHVARLISEQSEVAASWCRRPLAQATVIDSFRLQDCYGYQYEPLIPSRRPIASITEIVEDGTTLVETDYEYDEETGFLWKLDSNEDRVGWTGQDDARLTSAAMSC